MKDRKFLLVLLVVAVIAVGVLFGIGKLTLSLHKTIAAQAVAVKRVSQTISAGGSIHSRSEATLHFQTGGKLAYLPFKQGDSVYAGQTIASLDTYALQKMLQAQANAYQVANNTNAQIQENNQATIIEGQTRAGLDSTNHNSYNNITEAQVITDTVNRLVQNSLLTQNSAQLQVDLANYAISLASLTAPFTGVLISEDVTTPNVNITTTTGFSLADPTQKIFRAHVAASDIDFVSVGSKAVVTIDGQKKSLSGTVATIYPQKQTVSTGEQIYDVDIAVDGITNAAFGQNGSVVITSNDQTNALLVPSWVIVGHAYVWVWNGQKAVLKHVTPGATHGSMTEVQGVSKDEKLITSPENIARQTYQLL